LCLKGTVELLQCFGSHAVQVQNFDFADLGELI
jgi:hypothetical protein